MKPHWLGVQQCRGVKMCCLVSHEGGSFSEWEEGAIYDGKPVIMGIWADSYCTGAVLNMPLLLR